jgi:hypothetical protein
MGGASMKKKTSAWSIFLLTLLVLLPSPAVVFATSIFYDYIGKTGQLGGTYSGFIEFNAPAPSSFTVADIVNSQINYTNLSLSLTGFWPHSDLMSGGGSITGGLVEQFNLDWCCTSGDTNTSSGPTPQWAVSLGPFQGGTFITDVGTGGWVLRKTVAPIPEPSTMLLFGTGLAGLIGLRYWKGGKA